MVASGLPFGSRKATDRMHVWARPGGSAVKAPPLRGAFQKFATFWKKKFISRFSASLPPSCDRAGPYQKHTPGTAPCGVPLAS